MTSTLNDLGVDFLKRCGLERARFTQITSQNVCPESIILGLIVVESGGHSGAMRYERSYPYLSETKAWAAKFQWTEATEAQLQSFSYGLMQIMLATARSLDFGLHPKDLLDPHINLAWGCYYLRRLFTRYMDWQDAVASYNAGHPSRKLLSRKYVNQAYVDQVYLHAAEFENQFVIPKTI